MDGKFDLGIRRTAKVKHEKFTISTGFAALIRIRQAPQRGAAGDLLNCEDREIGARCGVVAEPDAWPVSAPDGRGPD